MNNEMRNQILRDFFSSYFHEDWSEDAESFEGILGEYVKQNPDPLALERLSGCLLMLVDSGMSEDDLEKFLFSDLGCYYVPSADGKTVKAWLRELARVLVEKGA